jgi:hypothetical protein
MAELTIRKIRIIRRGGFEIVHCQAPCGGHGARGGNLLSSDAASGATLLVVRSITNLALWPGGTLISPTWERSRNGRRCFVPLITETMMTKPVPPVPEDNQSHKGPGSAPDVPLDTTKGHRDDEKNNIREQAEHGNMTQNTSNRRSG